jgi:hypothetical protein
VYVRIEVGMRSPEQEIGKGSDFPRANLVPQRITAANSR